MACSYLVEIDIKRLAERLMQGNGQEGRAAEAHAHHWLVNAGFTEALDGWICERSPGGVLWRDEYILVDRYG